jgi:hypothetical protein
MVDWTHLCRGKEFDVEGSRVNVKLADERRHFVEVEEGPDAYLLQAVVLRPGAAAEIENLAVRMWLWNRNTSLVGFRKDTRGRLIGESWVPKATDAREFCFYLKAVATECDRVEYILTGHDKE